MPAGPLRIALLIAAASLPALSAWTVPVRASGASASTSAGTGTGAGAGAGTNASAGAGARAGTGANAGAGAGTGAGTNAGAGTGAPTGGWQVQAVISVPGESVQLNGVAARSPTSAWAAGGIAPSGSLSYQPLLVHWDGSAWRTVTLPARVRTALGTGQGLSVIGAWSASGFWAFDGLAGSWLRRDRLGWTAGQLPEPGAGDSRPVITSAVVLSRSDVWAFGLAVTAGGQALPYAAHRRGGIWRVVAMPGTSAVTDASGSSRANVWALIGGGPQTGTASALLHWNGHAWSQVSLTASLADAARLYSVLAVGRDSAWTGGGTPAGTTGVPGVTALWNGSDWQAWRLRRMTTAAVNLEFTLAHDGQGGVWAAAAGFGRGHFQLWHYTGGQWTPPVSLTTGGSRAFLGGLALVPGTTSLWAVGERLAGSAGQGVIAGYGTPGS